VHQHGIWQAWSRSVTDFGRRGPTMISPRGMLDPWARANAAWKKRLAWMGWERRNLTRATYLHALADAEAKAIEAILPGASIAVIPNGVTVGAEPPAAGRETDPKVCLFIARIHPKKGLARLFDQWAGLPETTRAAWRLEIAGPDEVGTRAQLEARVAALGLGARVRFLGPLHGEAKTAAFARASAFVLPSYSEGLPMAVLEAWSAGLPVLMTRACNLPEGFDAGAAHEIGDDPADLAAGLARDDLPAMGARGRALVAARFAWERIAARHVEVYAAMAQSRPLPREHAHA
jgi:poly(glycerol-phosphate) alpha-glucosyltransferase